jgi:hypothetical protein
MKRRDFLRNAAITGAGATAGITSVLASSCDSSSPSSAKQKVYTPEELGMYSFADKAPDGKPLKAALIGNGGRGTGAAVQFVNAGPNLSIVALADVFKDK